MGTRKPSAMSAAQMDLFEAVFDAAPAANDSERLEVEQADEANAVMGTKFGPQEPQCSPIEETIVGAADLTLEADDARSLKRGARARPFDDEWWTTAMVCAYLKMGRKALWTRRRSTETQFPPPIQFASQRLRWRSAEVKAWVETVEQKGRGVEI
jgi:predicted DNA-binding transcriptional regulator AlpA